MVAQLSTKVGTTVRHPFRRQLPLNFRWHWHQCRCHLRTAVRSAGRDVARVGRERVAALGHAVSRETAHGGAWLSLIGTCCRYRPWLLHSRPEPAQLSATPWMSASPELEAGRRSCWRDIGTAVRSAGRDVTQVRTRVSGSSAQPMSRLYPLGGESGTRSHGTRTAGSITGSIPRRLRGPSPTGAGSGHLPDGIGRLSRA